MSDGTPGAATLEVQIDDVLAVLAAVGAERPALVSLLEGAALASLFAASHPDRVQALAMMSPQPRMVRGPGYEWAQSVEERDLAMAAIIGHWGEDSEANPWVANAGDDAASKRAMARLQRQSMTPRAAARAQEMVGKIDVRGVLPSIQCPTLVLRREQDLFIDPQHSAYVTEHTPGARYVELPGAGAPWTGDVDGAVAEIEQFLTGTRRPVVSDRVLATVLFTDIVGSTERASQLGDGPWRSLLERHDALVRAEVERNRGRFVKSLGDGALAMFDGPSRAISAATAVRDSVARARPRGPLRASHRRVRAARRRRHRRHRRPHRRARRRTGGRRRGPRLEHRARPRRRLRPDAHRPRRARPQGRAGAVAALRGRGDVSRGSD